MSISLNKSRKGEAKGGGVGLDRKGKNVWNKRETIRLIVVLVVVVLAALSFLPILTKCMPGKDPCIDYPNECHLMGKPVAVCFEVNFWQWIGVAE